MLRVAKGNILHTRGDTGGFTINPTDSAGNVITTYTGTFSVKKQYDDTDYILQIEVKDNRVYFTHAMTKDLEPGDYVWDIEMHIDDGTEEGQYQTIGPGKYTLKPDVTR